MNLPIQIAAEDEHPLFTFFEKAGCPPEQEKRTKAMSADNAIAVRKVADGDWRVKMVFMSNDDHDFDDAPSFPTREAATIRAFEIHEGEVIVEYGVIEI